MADSVVKVFVSHQSNSGPIPDTGMCDIMFPLLDLQISLPQ